MVNRTLKVCEPLRKSGAKLQVAAVLVFINGNAMEENIAIEIAGEQWKGL